MPVILFARKVFSPEAVFSDCGIIRHRTPSGNPGLLPHLPRTNRLPAVAGSGWLDLDEAAMSIEAPVPTSVDESDKVK